MNKTLTQKLLFAFIFIGIIPYLLIIAYFSYWGRENILDNLHKRYALQAKHSKKLIESHLNQLTNELTFIANLELFDDMIALDVDYRITQLLEQKASINQESELILYALDNNFTIISASIEHKGTTLSLLHTNTYIYNNILHIIKPLSSSFDKRKLGYLVAEYPLKNLKRFMLDDVHVRFYTHINDRSIHDNFLPLNRPLNALNLYYHVNEKEALSFINHFIFYLSLIIILGIIVIYYSSKKLTKEIISPIHALQNATQKIIETKDYSLHVEIDSHDELAQLCISYNTLLQTTHNTLEELAKENEIRTQEFINLTNCFNDITQSSNHEESITLSIERLNTLIDYTILFSDTPSLSETKISLELQMQNAYLIIDKEVYSNELSRRFFDAIVSMITLQLERISLLDTIKSDSKAKSDFISALSHELRTPLSAIIGFSQYIISYEELSSDTRSSVEKIEKASYHLLDIINDILDIAKIEARMIELNRSDIHLNSLLTEVLDITSSLAKDINLLHDIETTETLHVQSDAKYLKQLLINLLSNAIKFTPKGSVTLSSSFESNQLIIQIIDTGVGISAKNLSKIFDEFTQLKNSGNSGQKGSGLGLVLSKNIAQALNFELDISSKGEGFGSTATLRVNL